MFVLRRKKKPPDPVELSREPETKMFACKGSFNLAKKVPNEKLKINPGQMSFKLLFLFVKISLWFYLLSLDLQELLFSEQCLPKSQPVLNETMNLDTNLLGELLTLQGVFQDSNCDSMSCFVGKYQTGDVVKNGMKADTFSNGATIKLLFDSGTSRTLSAHKEDFLRMTPLEQAKPIQGIGSTVTPIGEGYG